MRTIALVILTVGGVAAFGAARVAADTDGRLYVGHERGNRVTIVSVGNPGDPADGRVEGTVTGLPADLAFMKRLIDVVIKP